MISQLFGSAWKASGSALKNAFGPPVSFHQLPWPMTVETSQIAVGVAWPTLGDRGSCDRETSATTASAPMTAATEAVLPIPLRRLAASAARRARGESGRG